MLIELAFIACMISADDQCREENILAVDSTLLGCLVNAQAELAAWNQRHTAWQIKEFSCRYTRSVESKL
jgi:hypothetical protein